MSEIPKVPIWRIAIAFNQIALASFGGGLSAWSRQLVVEQRRWMTDEEFLSAMTVCRVLPGANQVNLAVFVGARLRGIPGAIAAVTGLLAAPMVIVLGLGTLYFAHRHDPSVEAVLRGMTAAAVALSLSMAYRTGRTCLRSPVSLGSIRRRARSNRGAARATADRACGARAACDVVGMAASTASRPMKAATALHLCLLFGGASLMSIGGGNSVVPDIELQAVDTYHWITRSQFADLFALAQAAPGPSILIVTLVGYAAAGVPGAVLATAAMVLPAAALVLVFARFWERARTSPWRFAFEHGLAPVAVGLIASSGIIVARGADHSLAQYRADGASDGAFLHNKGQPNSGCSLRRSGRMAGSGVSLQARINKLANGNIKGLVEPRGIEPLTFALRTRRSPS